MNIELDVSPSEADLQVIGQGIKAYNRKYMPDAVAFEPDTRFAAFARDEAGAVVGGVRVNAFWNYCLIELLWLSEAVRGQGVGTRLMHLIEGHAKAKGFEYIRTETLDVQARGFYEKLGYRVYGELADFPKGHTLYCVVKKL